MCYSTEVAHGVAGNGGVFLDFLDRDFRERLCPQVLHHDRRRAALAWSHVEQVCRERHAPRLARELRRPIGRASALTAATRA
jgi:hypothetical protein